MSIKIGEIVCHRTAPNFGIGLVKATLPDGKVVVDFDVEGEKIIAASHSHLLAVSLPRKFFSPQGLELKGMRPLKRGEKYHRNWIGGCWEFSFDKKLKDQNIKDASTVKEWHRRYCQIPEGILYDSDDLALATRSQFQYGNHFHEWLAAKMLYDRFGYLSLIEKYECPSHSRKNSKFYEIAGEGFARYASGDRCIEKNGKLVKDERQCPDLLVYSPDLKDWFFCEVKAGEPIDDNQEDFFPKVIEKSNRPIYLIVLKQE